MCITLFQASTTPLAAGQWLSQLYVNNPSNIPGDILAGNIPEFARHEEVNQFLRASLRRSEQDKIDVALNFEHFQKFSQKQQERKLSSPSKLHYGHMKSLSHDEDLLQIYFDMMNLTFKHNILLQRWLIVWEIMLAKDSPGSTSTVTTTSS